MAQGDRPEMKIFVKERAILNNLIGEAHEQEFVKSREKDADKTEAARKWMCENYFDIRTFGAVMSTGKNAGQVRGAVQLGFARSKDRIFTGEHTITRIAVATEAEAEKQKGDNRTMGRKFTIPYGLYEVHGFISASLAKQTGFSEDDLALFWDALLNMFDHDRSAARGEMALQKLIVFKHDSELGNAPARKLFDLITVGKNCGDQPPREFSDYTVTIDEANKPEGVSIEVKL
jgi:CRISPR-associated protein Csd2